MIRNTPKKQNSLNLIVKFDVQSLENPENSPSPSTVSKCDESPINQKNQLMFSIYPNFLKQLNEKFPQIQENYQEIKDFSKSNQEKPFSNQNDLKSSSSTGKKP